MSLFARSLSLSITHPTNRSLLLAPSAMQCCGTCASRVGVCDGWVYDPEGRQCWLLSGCKGYAKSAKRIMGLIPDAPTMAPTVPPPTAAPTGGAQLVLEVASATSFRLGVRFGGKAAAPSDPIDTPSLDPNRKPAAFTRVTDWDGTNYAGVQTAFGALLADAATGKWKLLDAKNRTVVTGDAPVVDHTFTQGRIELAVQGTGGTYQNVRNNFFATHPIITLHSPSYFPVRSQALPRIKSDLLTTSTTPASPTALWALRTTSTSTLISGRLRFHLGSTIQTTTQSRALRFRSAIRFHSQVFPPSLHQVHAPLCSRGKRMLGETSAVISPLEGRRQRKQSAVRRATKMCTVRSGVTTPPTRHA